MEVVSVITAYLSCGGSIGRRQLIIRQAASQRDLPFCDPHAVTWPLTDQSGFGQLVAPVEQFADLTT